MAAARRRAGDPVLLVALALTCFTDDPALARRAQAAGVDRVGPDLERIGKAERQAGLGTFVSAHEESALPALREAVGPGRLFARCDPADPGQLDRLVAAGVDVVMLPMFRGVADVARVRGRLPEPVRLVPLVETVEAVEAVEAVLALDGVDEVHVGLNDLSLALDLPNRFLALVHPAVEHVAAAAHAAGARLGLGGLGRADQDDLPVPAPLVHAQHARMRAGGALLSRSFLAGGRDLADDVRAVRDAVDRWRSADPGTLAEASEALRRAGLAAGAW